MKRKIIVVAVVVSVLGVLLFAYLNYTPRHSCRAMSEAEVKDYVHSELMDDLDHRRTPFLGDVYGADLYISSVARQDFGADDADSSMIVTFSSKKTGRRVVRGAVYNDCDFQWSLP